MKTQVGGITIEKIDEKIKPNGEVAYSKKEFGIPSKVLERIYKNKNTGKNGYKIYKRYSKDPDPIATERDQSGFEWFECKPEINAECDLIGDPLPNPLPRDDKEWVDKRNKIVDERNKERNKEQNENEKQHKKQHETKQNNDKYYEDSIKMYQKMSDKKEQQLKEHHKKRGYSNLKK